MSSVDVDIVIYDSKIAAMSLPGGQIWRWARQRRARVERLAIRKCPRRYGTLASTIRGTYNPGPPEQVIMEIHAGDEWVAPYAVWVHEGTHGPITSHGSWPMKLRPYPPRYPHTIEKYEVAGQRPQPFLQEALIEVMRSL